MTVAPSSTTDPATANHLHCRHGGGGGGSPPTVLSEDGEHFTPSDNNNHKAPGETRLPWRHVFYRKKQQQHHHHQHNNHNSSHRLFEIAIALSMVYTIYAAVMGRIVGLSEPITTSTAMLRNVQHRYDNALETVTVNLFDDSDDLPHSCHIQDGNMEYLGCGYNGQVFATSMQCHDIQDNHTKRKRSIVIKLLTFPANSTDTKKFVNGRIGTYKSDTPETTQKHKDLYKRMLPMDGTDKQRVLRHFAVQIGSVRLTTLWIHRAMQSANRSLSGGSPYRGMVYPVPEYDHRNHEHATSVRGQVFVHLGNTQNLRQILQQEKNIHIQQRQQIVRDLMFIYEYMFQQGVYVCDVKLEHFLYSQSTHATTLIDFDDVRFAGSNRHKNISSRDAYAQQWQQWQLLVLIAHVCDAQGIRQVQQSKSNNNKGHLLAPAGLASIACGATGGDEAFYAQAEQLFAQSFEKCGFDRASNVAWEVFSPDRKSNDGVAAVYQSLRQWSGSQ